MVFRRDLLRPQMFFGRQRVVGSAFDRGVIGDHHHLAAVDLADPGNDPGTRDLIVIESQGGQGRKLKERTVRVEQRGDAFARQQLAALPVLLARGRRTAFPDLGDLDAEIIDEGEHVVRIPLKLRRPWIDLGFKDRHKIIIF